MAIKITDIPSEGFALKLDQKVDLFDSGSATTDLQAELYISKCSNGDTVHISGKVLSSPILECSRCLEPFTFSVDSTLDIDVAPLRFIGDQAEHELVGSELEMEFYSGDEINPVDYVKEQILISIPMVPLHSPGCKGLCSTCGTDLNKNECGHQQNAPGDFGAFSALKDLLKK